MHDNEEQAKLGRRGSLTSRPNGFLSKAVSVVLGGALLVSAFVVSIAFVAVAFALLLGFGGYFWWKTRHLRRQVREQMQSSMGAQEAQWADRGRSVNGENVNRGDVIEGVVISRKETTDRS